MAERRDTLDEEVDTVDWVEVVFKMREPPF